MLPSLDEKDLSPYFNRPELIRQAAEQLKKDLAQAGVEITFSGNVFGAYDELFGQTEPVIRKFMEGAREKLMQLLYRIDISEKMLGEILANEKDAAARLTRLILFRELQKVVIRNFYGK